MKGAWYVVCSSAYSRGGFASEREAHVHAQVCAASSWSEDGKGCRHRIEFRQDES